MDDIISTKKMLEDFNELIDPAKGNVSSVWRKVVSKIKSIKDEDSEISMGEKIAQNTHVVDLKKGVLLVEAKHSGWIQYLRMYQKFILRGLAMECPELQIKTLAFRTRGSDVSLFDGYEEQLEKSLQKRNEEIELLEQSKLTGEAISMNVFIDTNYIEKEYNENDTIEDCYDYLKTLDKFKNAKDI